jgi:hypothetical protein
MKYSGKEASNSYVIVIIIAIKHEFYALAITLVSLIWHFSVSG